MLRPARRGATLAELLVALTLAAIVLGTATSSVLHQRRSASRLAHGVGADAQVRAALGSLAAELGALSAGVGDLVPGEASDTAIQLRSVVAAGLACADAVGSASFAPEWESFAAGAPAMAREGDSLWWYGGEPAGWRGRRIVGVDSIIAPCPLVSLPAVAVRRAVVAEPDSVPYGALLRVTRPIRYAFYRGGDGSWQLGVREWVAAAGRFAGPQPVAGPFLMRAGALRTGFRFFDASGGELAAGGVGGVGGVAAERVARIRVTVIAAEGPGARGGAVRPDSVDVALMPVRAP